MLAQLGDHDFRIWFECHASQAVRTRQGDPGVYRHFTCLMSPGIGRIDCDHMPHVMSSAGREGAR